MMKQRTLELGWQLKKRDPSIPIDGDFRSFMGWIPATVPGVVHQDLIANDEIPNPYDGFNEKEVQWVGEADWLYRCSFTLPADWLAEKHIRLCFDGLDTFAQVWLNGSLILQSKNMFLPQEVEVKPYLTTGKNALWISFESSYNHGRQIEKEYTPLVGWNTDTSRVYVRKAGYHYGWDWGPVLITSGPWRTVRLQAYHSKISELKCPVTVASDLSVAGLPVELRVQHPLPGMEARITILDPDGQEVEVKTVQVVAGYGRYQFSLSKPQLWWPNGYGKQELYTIQVKVIDNGEVLDQAEQRIGIRSLRLVQEPFADEQGRSFYFEVNNTPIFCTGANWIPADNFTPRISKDRYREWLTLAKEANMVMLRVWGGGIYEEDVFYDTCDELGLLVWQDFMFACAIYPAHPEFLESVNQEAEAQVRRLRHHACLALWCGNNEDYQTGRRINGYDPSVQENLTTTKFPAREIYERLLPQVCADLDPTRSYWPGSPYWTTISGEGDALVGDDHIWNVWHGVVAPYQDYDKFTARFVSEFGMQAFPDLSFIERFISPDQRQAHSAMIEFHNKATDGPQRLEKYVLHNLPEPANLDEYIYASQLIQAEALASAIRAWRRRWQGKGSYKTAGSLIWQLDDCWPVISWAIADYELRPKPAYYVVRREFGQFQVGLAQEGGKISYWVVNGSNLKIMASVVLDAWNLDGENVLHEVRMVELEANQANELGEMSGNISENCVVSIKLMEGQTVLGRGFYWPEPLKRVKLSDPEIVIEQKSADEIVVTSKQPAKGVWLWAGDGVNWSENMLDLAPGEARVIRAKGLNGRNVKVRWLET